MAYDKEAHLAAIRKYPAAYSFMALVMDDISIDEAAAKDKWGGVAVRITQGKLGDAITGEEARSLFRSVSHHMASISRGLDPEEDDDDDGPVIYKQGGPAWQQPTPSRQQAAQAAARPHPQSKPNTPSEKDFDTVDVLVTKVWDEDYVWQGKKRTRRMMQIMTGNGQKFKGTRPAAVATKLEAGDTISFTAVFGYKGRVDEFGYPKDVKILHKAAPGTKVSTS